MEITPELKHECIAKLERYGVRLSGGELKIPLIQTPPPKDAASGCQDDLILYEDVLKMDDQN